MDRGTVCGWRLLAMGPNANSIRRRSRPPRRGEEDSMQLSPIILLPLVLFASVAINSFCRDLEPIAVSLLTVSANISVVDICSLLTCVCVVPKISQVHAVYASILTTSDLNFTMHALVADAMRYCCSTYCTVIASHNCSASVRHYFSDSKSTSLQPLIRVRRLFVRPLSHSHI